MKTNPDPVLICTEMADPDSRMFTQGARYPARRNGLLLDVTDDLGHLRSVSPKDLRFIVGNTTSTHTQSRFVSQVRYARFEIEGRAPESDVEDRP